MKDEFKINIVPNKSRTYMLPFLSSQFNFDLADGLLNTYLSFDKEDELFCLLYDWSSDSEFLKFEGMLMKHVLFVTHEDYNGKTLYKFRLSRNMLEGRDKFIEGLYTDFSEEHKDSIVHYLCEIKAGNMLRIVEILNPDGALSSTPPDMNNEVFSNSISKMIITRDDFS